MGGTVGADSEPGEGSRFWFELSLERVERPARPAAEERELAGLRVLVVDDNATNRAILAAPARLLADELRGRRRRRRTR